MVERPNILIIMPDQQRADCLSCAGHPQVRTPNMDRIASQGVRFTQATTVSPVCMPARASFANSLYPHNHGMWRNRGCMPAGDDTFFHQMQSAGYFTAYIGKSHYYGHGGMGHMRNYEGYMHARGLEYVHEVTGPLATRSTRSYMTDRLEEHDLYEAFKEDYAERGKLRGENPFLVRPSPLPVEHFLDSYVGQQAASFIEGYSDQRPLCLFVGFPGPHEPWDAPGEYAEMYDPEDTPDPIPYSENDMSIPAEIREMEDFQPMGCSTQDNIRRIRANYYGKISLIDRWVGEILDACDDSGLGEDMMTVYWSDHGELLGDHRRVFKMTFHESSMRVPLMVSWPGHIDGGQTCDSLVEIIDVYPTLMEAINTEPPVRCMGRSLFPVLNEPGSTFRDSQLSEICFADERRICLRTQDYKYSVRQNGDGYMLYDLSEDPDEQNNLVCQGNVIEGEMRDRLFRRIMASQYTMNLCDQLG